jgi:murein L,D-transpeptidase YcbB/YkuD
VLDALGLTVAEYQASRGLTVDGWVGPQTGAALCAEDLPEGGA